MKLIDKETRISFNDLYLYLNRKEASELTNEVKKLLDNPLGYTASVLGENVNGKLTKKITIRIERKDSEESNQ